jgi:hypothetical protein
MVNKTYIGERVYCISLSNLLIMGVSDECYSRNESCAFKFDINIYIVILFDFMVGFAVLSI